MGQACATVCELLGRGGQFGLDDGPDAGRRLPKHGMEMQTVPVAMATPLANSPWQPTVRAAPVAVAATLAHSSWQPTVGASPVAVAAAVPLAQAATVPSHHGAPQGVVNVGVQQLQAPLTGRRRSLLIGINYHGTNSELSGCINDVMRMRPVLERFGFDPSPSSQRVLVDDGRHEPPSYRNMLAAFHWLVDGVQTGDALFFHYSGHGGREECSMDEAADGHHETLCPVDYAEAGQILDKDLFKILVRPVPSGAKLTCLLDCCHSAGALDLPYMFTGTAENIQRALASKAATMFLSRDWARSISQWNDGHHMGLLTDIGSMGLGLWSLWQEKKAAKDANSAGFVTDEAGNAGLSVGEVIAITGCRSDQTSADVGNVHDHFRLHSAAGGRGSLIAPSGRTSAGGALTAAFIEAVEGGTMSMQKTYLEILEHIRQKLQDEGFSQVPQFASSLLIELQQNFALDRISLPPTPTSNSMKSRGISGASGSKGVHDFMSSLANKQAGRSLLQNATAADGSSPLFSVLAAGGAAALMGAFDNSPQEHGNDAPALVHGLFNAVADSDDVRWFQDAGQNLFAAGTANFASGTSRQARDSNASDFWPVLVDDDDDGMSVCDMSPRDAYI